MNSDVEVETSYLFLSLLSFGLVFHQSICPQVRQSHTVYLPILILEESYSGVTVRNGACEELGLQSGRKT